MGRHIVWLLKRGLQYIVGLVLLLSLCFFLLRFFPGNPFDEDVVLHPQVKQKFEQEFALDQPVFTQYILFLKNLTNLNLGNSMVSPEQSVVEILAPKILITLRFAVLALLLAAFAGFLIACFFMWRANDALYEMLTLSVLSLPVLTLAPVLIGIFSFYLDWLPAARLDQWSSWVLPLVVLSARPSIQLARVLKTRWQEVQQLPFVRTSQAFGIPKHRIRYVWSLRSALTPYVSYLGIVMTSLLSGSLIVENLFAIPGAGMQFVESLLNRDLPVIVAFTLFSGLVMMSAQILVDVALYVLDPKMRVSE